MEWKKSKVDVEAAVSVDWFGMSCALAVPYDDRPLILPSGWQQVVMGSTAVWAVRIIIMDGLGQKVATFLTRAHSGEIDERRALLEVANYWLYLDTFSDVVEILCGMFPMSVDGMNRVDLCCDFQMDDAKWQVFRALECGDAYVKALRRGVVWWSSDVGTRVPHQLSWGGKESVFKWKLYWKWKELHEGGVNVCSKPYIEELWNAVGFEPRCVWRLECSISHTNRLSLADGERRLLPLDWWLERSDIFCSLYADKFVIRLAQGHKDRRNDEIVQFLKLDGRKMLRHSLPSDVCRETNAQRMIAYRLWCWLNDVEVQADNVAFSGVWQHLVSLCEDEAVVNYIAFRSGKTRSEIVECLCECEKVAMAVRPFYGKGE